MASVAEAYWRLGNLTSSVISRMQAALERQRPLLLYGREGRLQELLVQRICWRAAALKRLSGSRGGSTSMDGGSGSSGNSSRVSLPRL